MKIKNPPWIYFIFLFPNYRVLSSLKRHQFLLLLIPRFTFILSYQSYFILPPLPPDPPLETPLLQPTMKTITKSSGNFSFFIIFSHGLSDGQHIFGLCVPASPTLCFSIGSLLDCLVCISLICAIPQNCATGPVLFYLTIQFSLIIVLFIEWPFPICTHSPDISQEFQNSMCICQLVINT